ncbi:hypothetical protein FHW36_10554 [Chitinophaga polysaccharea]|uniref:cGAS/DncV-like nucleotidyltransferase C-terminal helical domain-containing protein n=1 Tax=Chitinophaga polysaccharea TaxID=1293035 RepID=A0A561PNC3_9BACT|nr:hypothetical protein [Chitinophaga polysaccharea]TWF39617.1 hypothetical protein FHW36_10554 [Chitinophaga polysaccharea]
MQRNNYRELIQGVRNRLDPESRVFTKSLNEDLSTLSYGEVREYVNYAMRAVDTDYTARSKQAGERVKNHLIDGGISADFKYQGSVMTDTHIKGVSDIDLLAVSKQFYSCDNAGIKKVLEDAEARRRYYTSQIEKLKREEAAPLYKGDVCSDLCRLRVGSETVLCDVYTVCDISKPKSIKIRNKDLGRDVDVVIANWYDDVNSIVNDKGDSRGIQVYNKLLNVRGKIDFPFMSIDRINSRSAETGGRLKKMIRFLKNIKAKSSLSIDLTSFDFNAICYSIAVDDYQSISFYELVFVLQYHLTRISSSSLLSDNVKSVDGKEYIFKDNPQKLQGLKNIIAEIDVVATDLRTQIL